MDHSSNVGGDSLGQQNCDYFENGEMLHNACMGDPYLLLLPGQSNFNLTVTPEDANL